MPTSAELTDAYLAQLLEKEANDKSNGLSRRMDRPRDAPKPNVRFLRNIIKETDSHNSILIEREKRLAALNSRRARDHITPRRDREPAVKRQRVERPDRWASVLGQVGIKPRREENDPRRDRAARESHRGSRDERRKQSRSPRRGRDRSHSPRKEKRARSRERRSRSRSPYRPHRKTNETHDSDSDPLEALVGPLPASKQKARGRGVTADSSGIDSRFADPNYDPSKDIQPEEDDDWTMALSALQDRQKWQVMNADRLRAAGFSEDEVRKWEVTSNITPRAEKDVDDVRWSKKGEARDWDLGKTVDAAGDVITKAPWADA